MIQFIASLKDTGKPIKFDNEQNAEVVLIMPASEVQEVIKLLALCGTTFKVTIEVQ